MDKAIKTTPEYNEDVLAIENIKQILSEFRNIKDFNALEELDKEFTRLRPHVTKLVGRKIPRDYKEEFESISKSIIFYTSFIRTYSNLKNHITMLYIEESLVLLTLIIVSTTILDILEISKENPVILGFYVFMTLFIVNTLLKLTRLRYFPSTEHAKDSIITIILILIVTLGIVSYHYFPQYIFISALFIIIGFLGMVHRAV